MYTWFTIQRFPKGVKGEVFLPLYSQPSVAPSWKCLLLFFVYFSRDTLYIHMVQGYVCAPVCILKQYMLYTYYICVELCILKTNATLTIIYCLFFSSFTGASHCLFLILP